MPDIDRQFLRMLEEAALAAGRAIMTVRDAMPKVEFKPDRSPVTEADRQAETIILAALAAHCPRIPVVAEEAVAAGCVPDISGGTFFLVDPLDGTREFINARDEFTVNIALVVDAEPVVGIVYAPARHVGYCAGPAGAERFTTACDAMDGPSTPIGCRAMVSQAVAVCSRSHDTPDTAAFLSDHGIAASTAIGSSLKFCLLAEGSADVYPRFSPTMEWDTAAGDAVLRAAGGMTRTSDGLPLRYGKPGFANPGFVAASGSWAGRGDGITKRPN